jgi:hypothetical protein
VIIYGDFVWFDRGTDLNELKICQIGLQIMPLFGSLLPEISWGVDMPTKRDQGCQFWRVAIYSEGALP